MKEAVPRESMISSDKPNACAAALNSPLMPPAPDSSPAQPYSFRSPFLIGGPPDVFNSPSVKCTRTMETSRRRSSPFPHSLQHSNKKMRLSSTELPDSRSSLPEPDMSPPPVVNNMSPLSPIRSPSAEDGSDSMLPAMQTEDDADDEFNASPDSQANSVGAQVCSPASESESPSSLIESPSDEVPSASDLLLPSFGSLDDSLSPQPPSPDRELPVVPESPASSSSPLASSPPLALQSYSAPEQEPTEPEITHCSSPPQSGSLLSDSDVCSSTAASASVADLPSSSMSSPAEVDISSPTEVDASSPAEIELIDEDEEIESGEKLVDSANNQDIHESTTEAHEAHSVTEVAQVASSAEGTVFR